MAGFFLLSGCGMFFQKLKSKILIFWICCTVGSEQTALVRFEGVIYNGLIGPSCKIFRRDMKEDGHLFQILKGNISDCTSLVFVDSLLSDSQMFRNIFLG